MAHKLKVSTCFYVRIDVDELHESLKAGDAALETFQDDFRECPQNTNRITPYNELICYNATAKVDVESKYI